MSPLCYGGRKLQKFKINKFIINYGNKYIWGKIYIYKNEQTIKSENK